MILIRRGTTQNIYLTLNEKTTLTSPQFLFRLRNQTENKYKLFIAADTSSYTDRFNKFSVTESNTEDTQNGTVQLKPGGFWDYEVWEQPSGQNTLDVARATTLLETGIVKVKYNTAENTWTERNHVQSDTFIEYGSGTAA